MFAFKIDLMAVLVIAAILGITFTMGLSSISPNNELNKTELNIGLNQQTDQNVAKVVSETMNAEAIPAINNQAAEVKIVEATVQNAIATGEDISIQGAIAQGAPKAEMVIQGQLSPI